MKLNVARIALAAGLITCTKSVWATPPVIGRWEASRINVGFHNSIPNECIEQALFAATEWNDTGAKFDLDVDIIDRQPGIADQTEAFDFQNITFETGVPSDPNAVMSARVGTRKGTMVIVNADVIVDQRRLQATPTSVLKLSCAGVTAPPSDRIDFQSAALHELGHTVGLGEDQADASCAMFKSLAPGVQRRGLCVDEKNTHITNYGKRFQIASIPNVTGPQEVNIPAKVFYEGTGKFPVTRETRIISCPSGWSCADYNGSYASEAPSPLAFNFRCYDAEAKPDATFQWRTTLIDANGVRTNSVSHTSTCTKPAGAHKQDIGAKPTVVSRIIITD